jgi:chromosome segregation ATPase
MERPHLTEASKSKEEILARLGQIDKTLFGLSEALPHAPAEFEESPSGDDNAAEAESLDQKLAEIRREREQLEAERDDLRAQLAQHEANQKQTS